MCQVRHLDVEAGSSSLCLLMRGSTSRSLLYSVHCLLHTAQYTLSTSLHYIMKGSISLSVLYLHCALCTSHFALCTVHCTVQTAQWTLFTVYKTPCNEGKHIFISAVDDVHCALHIVYFALHNKHRMVCALCVLHMNKCETICCTVNTVLRKTLTWAFNLKHSSSKVSFQIWSTAAHFPKGGKQ